MEAVIRAPTQARSRGTMDKIYRSLSKLLKDRSFDRITINDLAEEAGVAVGSIYARFKDKNALLVGLYGNVAKEADDCIGDLTAPANWTGMGDRQMLEQIIGRVIKFYKRNAHISRAAVLSDQAHVFVTMQEVWKRAIALFVDLITDRDPTRPADKTVKAVKLCVRVVSAIMNQTVILPGADVFQAGRADRELITQLAKICCGILNDTPEQTKG